VSDKDDLLALFGRFGIETVVDVAGGTRLPWHRQRGGPIDVDSTVRTTDEHYGFEGLHTEFYFGRDGEFLAWGAWE
jgi:hypothetical protein